jgi:hypothetical protein
MQPAASNSNNQQTAYGELEARRLRIAAQFFDRSDATKAFQRGMNAHKHPQFYRQLGQETARTDQCGT